MKFYPYFLQHFIRVATMFLPLPWFDVVLSWELFLVRNVGSWRSCHGNLTEERRLAQDGESEPKVLIRGPEYTLRHANLRGLSCLIESSLRDDSTLQSIDLGIRTLIGFGCRVDITKPTHQCQHRSFRDVNQGHK